MTFQEFQTTYEIIFDEPMTIKSGTTKPFFEHKKVSLKNRATGQIIETPVSVESGSESLAEDLTWGWFSKLK